MSHNFICPFTACMQGSKCSYAGHSEEGPLKMAELKLQHALSVQSSDHASCYHLGRVKLLLAETCEAEQVLLVASAMRPCHEETALCLGLALSTPKQRSQFLYHGLLYYLDVKQRETEGESQPEGLHGRFFWRSANILIVSLCCLVTTPLLLFYSLLIYCRARHCPH